MEHRLSDRRSIALDVILYYRPIGLVRGRIVNWSEGGMFIDTGAVRLSRNALVELAITTPAAEASRGQRSERLQGWVVHIHRDGAGLMITNTATRAYQQLMHHLAPAYQTAATGVHYRGEIQQLGHTA